MSMEQGEKCEKGIVSWYCWNCIRLDEDTKGFAYCLNNPSATRTHIYLASSIKPIDSSEEE